MLYTELKSEEVTERDLLQRVLFVENLNLLVLPDLRTKRIINLLLRKELEENSQDLEFLTHIGLDKILPSNSLKYF